MLSKTEIKIFVNHCKTNLDLSNLTKPDENSYHNLPLCIINAVFSIGINYTFPGNTVQHILRRCSYPPDLERAATELVLEQTEVLCNEF